MITFKEKNIDDFFEVPFKIYKENSLYISPLKSDLKRFLSKENPLFKKFGVFTFFTAYKDNKLVGRIVCHVHKKSNERHNLKRAYFGFFDCIHDIEVAKALLQKAEDFARLNRCDELAGNFNLTAMQQIGVLVDGFENVPYIDQVYNPEYIPQLLVACGFEKFFPMTTHELDLEKIIPESLMGIKQQELIKNKDYQFAKMTKKISL